MHPRQLPTVFVFGSFYSNTHEDLQQLVSKVSAHSGKQCRFVNTLGIKGLGGGDRAKYSGTCVGMMGHRNSLGAIVIAVRSCGSSNAVSLSLMTLGSRVCYMLYATIQSCAYVGLVEDQVEEEHILLLT